MRKVKTSDELRHEYKREDLGMGVRGKYLKEYRKGTNLVLLSPDVANVFSTEEAVNQALRSLIRLCESVFRFRPGESAPNASAPNIYRA